MEELEERLSLKDRFNLRVDVDTKEILRKLAKRYRLSMSEIVRRYVIEGDRKVLGDYEH